MKYRDFFKGCILKEPFAIIVYTFFMLCHRLLRDLKRFHLAKAKNLQYCISILTKIFNEESGDQEFRDIVSLNNTTSCDKIRTRAKADMAWRLGVILILIG